MISRGFFPSGFRLLGPARCEAGRRVANVPSPGHTRIEHPGRAAHRGGISRVAPLYSFIISEPEAGNNNAAINKVRLLGTLLQYWRKTAAGIFNAVRQNDNPQPGLEELERDLLALTTEYQALAGRLERTRVDYEHRWSGVFQQIEALGQALRQSESARTNDAGRLLELEQRLARVETENKLAGDQVKALETALAEATTRLESRNNQLKFLQDSAREQHRILKTALAEATSRLETRDSELRQQQDSALEQIAALEATQAVTADHIAVTDHGVSELRTGIAELTRQHAASLSSTTIQLEATNNQVKALEERIEAEHRLAQNISQDTLAQLRRQDERLKRATAIAVITLVLVAVAGAVLYWN